MKRPTARSRTQDTSGLSRQCSATELRQPDNHQPSICTAQVVLNASVAHLSATQYVLSELRSVAVAQWQSTGGSSQRCPGFDSRWLPAFSLSSIFASYHLKFLYFQQEARCSEQSGKTAHLISACHGTCRSARGQGITRLYIWHTAPFI